MQVTKQLKLFFEEKDLPFAIWEIEHEGVTHMVESDFIIDMILNRIPIKEQEGIRDVLFQIDFRNGDCMHFLNHLATCYVKASQIHKELRI